MTVSVEIMTQGEEIITGQVVDSNSAWLSEQLVELGFKVARHSTVGDHLTDLTHLLQEIAQRADCCICSGGLGPTTDDLTAEAVSQAFNIPLVFDPQAYADIQAFFERRNRPMPDSNRKQAMLPQGAIRIDNHWGTAPGFALQYGQCWFAFVPGVPTEMQQLFNTSIKPYLQQHYSVQPSHLVTLKTVGIGESALQALLNDIVLPDTVQLGFRAGTEVVQTKLLFSPDFPDADKNALIEQYAAKIGDFVFTIEGLDQPSGDLIDVIAASMNTSRQTLGIIETISQGLIAAKCVGQPWLKQSTYQHSLTALTEIFGITLQTHDLMATAVTLAQTLQQQGIVDLALVQLALMDDTLKQDDNSLTLYSALASNHNVYTQTLTVGGTLKRKQNQAALMALDLLRRFLQKKAYRKYR